MAKEPDKYWSDGGGILGQLPHQSEDERKGWCLTGTRCDGLLEDFGPVQIVRDDVRPVVWRYAIGGLRDLMILPLTEGGHVCCTFEEWIAACYARPALRGQIFIDAEGRVVWFGKQYWVECSDSDFDIVETCIRLHLSDCINWFRSEHLKTRFKARTLLAHRLTLGKFAWSDELLADWRQKPSLWGQVVEFEKIPTLRPEDYNFDEEDWHRIFSRLALRGRRHALVSAFVNDGWVCVEYLDGVELSRWPVEKPYGMVLTRGKCVRAAKNRYIICTSNSVGVVDTILPGHIVEEYTPFSMGLARHSIGVTARDRAVHNLCFPVGPKRLTVADFLPG